MKFKRNRSTNKPFIWARVLVGGAIKPKIVRRSREEAQTGGQKNKKNAGKTENRGKHPAKWFNQQEERGRTNKTGNGGKNPEVIEELPGNRR